MFNLWLLKKLGLKVATTYKNDCHIENEPNFNWQNLSNEEYFEKKS